MPFLHYRMKLFPVRSSIAAAFLLCAAPIAVWSQAPSPPPSDPLPSATTPAEPSAAPAATPEVEQSDRWASLRDESERLLQVWEKSHSDNMALVERALKTRVCQDKRVGGLLDRTMEAMHAYLAAAQKYWEVWEVAERKRVDDQQKTLANMEVDLQRVEVMLDDEKKNRELLDQKESALEQSTRTEQIRKEIDEVKNDIRDSEDHLNKAHEQFDSITVSIKNMKASITARLIDIRQSSARLEAWGLDQTSVYEAKRKAAHEVCNTKQPGTMHTPLPKPTANP
jgi:chromosome segregation ATPase